MSQESPIVVLSKPKYYLNWKLLENNEECHASFDQLHQAELWRSWLINHERARYVTITKNTKQETFEGL